MKSATDLRQTMLHRASALLQVVLLVLLIAQPIYAIEPSRGDSTSLIKNHAGHLPLEEDVPTPAGNAAEENTVSGISETEDFLHGSGAELYRPVALLFEYHPARYSIYQAFHAEQLIPPPDRY